MIVIGSYALSLHGIQTGRRQLDYDLIGTFDELSALTRYLKRMTPLESIPLSQNKTVLRCASGAIVEFEIAWSGTAAAALAQMVEQTSLKTSLFGAEMGVPSLDQLYTLKMSHRYLKDSPHFHKTRADIMLMREYGAKVFDQEWLKQREDETYWYKHPKLNVKKGDFFKGDGVKYVYDHDDIHTAVAHMCVHDAPGFPARIPAYTLYMKDGAQVQCSKEKFFAAEERVRLWGVLEEAYVLALERSQIPFRGEVGPRRSFDMALMKVCTSITSGWFREFAWENLEKVEALYDDSYVDRFWNAVQAGLVKDYDPEKAAY